MGPLEIGTQKISIPAKRGRNHTNGNEHWIDQSSYPFHEKARESPGFALATWLAEVKLAPQVRPGLVAPFIGK